MTRKRFQWFTVLGGFLMLCIIFGGASVSAMKSVPMWLNVVGICISAIVIVVAIATGCFLLWSAAGAEWDRNGGWREGE